MEPITGYGDFSGVEHWHVDWYEVTTLEIQCLRDQGFAVEVIPPEAEELVLCEVASRAVQRVTDGLPCRGEHVSQAVKVMRLHRADELPPVRDDGTEDSDHRKYADRRRGLSVHSAHAPVQQS